MWKELDTQDTQLVDILQKLTGEFYNIKGKSIADSTIQMSIDTKIEWNTINNMTLYKPNMALG